MSWTPAYYVGDAECWCEGCATKAFGSTDGVDSEGNDVGAVSDESSGHPVHCAGCGAFMENALTTEGYDYVLEHVVSDLAGGRTDSVAVTEWAPFYDIPTSLDPDRYADRFDIVQGAYWACSDYHGGQWSKGYRHLSKLGRHYRPGAMERGPDSADAVGAYVRVAVNLLRGRQ